MTNEEFRSERLMADNRRFFQQESARTSEAIDRLANAVAELRETITREAAELREEVVRAADETQTVIQSLHGSPSA
jgi:hypothetical protein